MSFFNELSQEAAAEAAGVGPVNGLQEANGAERLSACAASGTKRVLDLVVAGALLLLLAPLLLIIAAAIIADSDGPILFRQQRSGLGGTPFRVAKFRTMRVAEDGDAINQATRKDPRVTRTGSFLRRSSLDELPQLLNVLAGDMSLVGPRPHALAHDRQFAGLVADYNRRFRVRPGITGLAQSQGLRGEIRTLEQLQRRVELDMRYVDEWSFASDLAILVKTAVVFAFHKSAY